MEKLLIILKLLPALIAAIKAIEEAIPGEGKGEAKLKAVREIIETVDGSLGTLWPLIAQVIGKLVAAFNESGVFVKKAA